MQQYSVIIHDLLVYDIMSSWYLDQCGYPVVHHSPTGFKYEGRIALEPDSGYDNIGGF